MSHQLLDNPVTIFFTIIAVILIAPLVSEWVRLPGIAGLMLAGMLIGPFGLKLLKADETFELLATVGIIYLMFSAGLEINLHQFNRVRNKAIFFGVLTYLAPQLVGIGFGRLYGLDWLGAILLGSAFASHTLLAFPILIRLGIVNNESLAVTIGATVFTDVAAFLVLALVSSASTGAASIAQFVRLIVFILVYAVVILGGLPRLGKFFFRRFTNQTVEFQFVLVALFIAAFLAELIGMHGVVGAFLAGLAINATLPHRSAVTGRVLFLGEAFFIPLFLVHSGMITDPQAFVQDSQSLLLGLAFTTIAYGTKFVAAWLASRFLGYSKDELMTVWGLSQAQAAVTLPTVLIGLQLGLFNQAIFNGIILMILATSITSPLIVQKYGSRLRPSRPESHHRSLFDRVLVPIANPKTQEFLISLASILTRTVKGTLLPLHVALKSGSEVTGLENQKRLLEADILRDPDTNIQPLRRVDTSVPAGILHAALESEASLIVLGWRGKPTFQESLLGTMLDQVVWNSKVPVLVGRLRASINAMHRLLLVVPANSQDQNLMSLSLSVVTTIAHALNIPVTVLAAPGYLPHLQATLHRLNIEHPCAFTPLENNIVQHVSREVQSEDDLIVVVSSGSQARFRSSLGHIPEELMAATNDSIVIIHYPE